MTKKKVKKMSRDAIRLKALDWFGWRLPWWMPTFWFRRRVRKEMTRSR